MSRGEFAFKIKAKWGSARNGQLYTPHGIIETPVFMPVGTRASVKSLDTWDLDNLKAEIILGNTYHLMIKPGAKLIKELGGLHSFMNWKKPILTDSGGFQVSSLGLFLDQTVNLKKSEIDEEGVTFYSYWDGSKYRLTPKIAMAVQADLGADIIMAFDEATPDQGREYAKEAMIRTHKWLEGCVTSWRENEKQKLETQAVQALFGIIQGGRYADLRLESAKVVNEYNLPGIALGGESVGGDIRATIEHVEGVKAVINRGVPLYTLGLGTEPNEIIQAIAAGVDMFDCVAPTRWARTGLLYCGEYEAKVAKPYLHFESDFLHARLDIGKSVWAKDTRPIMPGCDCYTCQSGYSRAYLHHLFKIKELTYYRLATIHNVRVMMRGTELMRQLIWQRGSGENGGYEGQKK